MKRKELEDAILYAIVKSWFMGLAFTVIVYNAWCGYTKIKDKIKANWKKPLRPFERKYTDINSDPGPSDWKEV